MRYNYYIEPQPNPALNYVPQDTGSMSSLSKSIRNAKSGSTIEADANISVIPAYLMKQIKGKDVNLQIKASNGSTITINGTKVTKISAMLTLNVKYNTKNIPESLVNKVKKLGTSTAKFSFGENKAFGFACDLTVKFNSKNIGKTATLYHYDSKNNQLTLAAKAVIGTDGKATFKNLTHGGDFIAIIK